MSTFPSLSTQTPADLPQSLDLSSPKQSRAPTKPVRGILRRSLQPKLANDSTDTASNIVCSDRKASPSSLVLSRLKSPDKHQTLLARLSLQTLATSRFIQRIEDSERVAPQTSMARRELTKKLNEFTQSIRSLQQDSAFPN